MWAGLRTPSGNRARVTPGQSISAGGHVVLLGWLILGWGLNADPLPFDVAQVSVVSGAEYAEIVAATSPQPSTDQPPAPEAPVVEATPPAPVAEQVTPEPPPTPEAVQPPVRDAPPPPAPEVPPPPTELTDVAPPEPAPPEVFTPPPSTIVDNSPRPTPRPAPRVAPVAVAPPPPDTTVAEVEQQAAADAPAEVVVEQPTEAAAPQEAATEIVTEAEKPSGAPTTSIRPPTRPRPPAAVPATPQTQTASTPAPDSPSTTGSSAAADPVAAAVAAAAASAPANAVADGPPMTGSEKESFRVAVNACWNVDPGAEWARVTVVVGFSLGQDGKVQGEPRLVSASGGTDAQANTAFQTARRAILRCQSSGYQLPADKYNEWKDVEITFDPSGMRLR